MPSAKLKEMNRVECLESNEFGNGFTGLSVWHSEAKLITSERANVAITCQESQVTLVISQLTMIRLPDSQFSFVKSFFEPLSHIV